MTSRVLRFVVVVFMITAGATALGAPPARATTTGTYVIDPISGVSEGDTSVLVSVTRTSATDTSDTVDYDTADGTSSGLTLPPDITNPATANATAPEDYTATEGTLVFGPGIVTQTFSVPITDDDIVEDPEVFRVLVNGAEAYVEIYDNDVAPQDWHVAITTPPPASAHVGDTVSVGYSVSVDPGADDLTVTNVAAGAGTSGLDSASFPSPPTSVAAGTTTPATGTARVVAPPGTGGVHLQITVSGTLGADSSDKSAATATIAVAEALRGKLTVDKHNIRVGRPLTYTLTFTNSSATPAQLSGLPAGFVPPAGTTLTSRSDGSTTVAANGGASVWTLVVGVDDADTNGQVITQAPTGVQYAMADVGLAARPVPLSPANVSSTVQAAVVGVSSHQLSDLDGGSLLPGDVVRVTITVANSGGAPGNATLRDALSQLQAPTDVLVDGSPCGAACTVRSASVIAALGNIPAGGSRVVTFTVTVRQPPTSNTASSGATVAFHPATAGASPTPANVATLSIAA
ncbi:MAG TPA: Calx-beta domain-containing protein [Acidimicrobiales bacterium]|nr:Calx-beta domain-containing protein [Acidimicrobiales bacterium]